MLPAPGDLRCGTLAGEGVAVMEASLRGGVSPYTDTACCLRTKCNAAPGLGRVRRVASNDNEVSALHGVSTLRTLFCDAADHPPGDTLGVCGFRGGVANTSGGVTTPCGGVSGVGDVGSATATSFGAAL